MYTIGSCELEDMENVFLSLGFMPLDALSLDNVT